MDDFTSLNDILLTVPEGSDVDFMVESPGGSAEVAELITRLLRGRFKSVRFVVPQMAMSAATILVMSGDAILMDYRSSLGPIDPQIMRLGAAPYPAQSYLDWLDKAAEEESKYGKLSQVTLAILQKVTPVDIQLAEDATEQAKRLVVAGLVKHMWKDLVDANGAPVPAEAKQQKAACVAEKLASHKESLSYGKMLSKSDLLQLDPDLRIVDYATTPMASVIWEIWVNIHYTFNLGGAFKMMESAATRIVKQVNMMNVQNPGQPGLPQIPAMPQPTKALQIAVNCGKCGAPTKIQADFEVGAPPPPPGFLRWPTGDTLACPNCQNSIDLKPIKAQIKQQTGQDVIG